MFIDYNTLMLINMVAGLVALAFLVVRGLDRGDLRMYVATFGATGLVAFLTGLHMVWTWPLPGSYNSAFGETSVLLGVLFLGAALSLARGWPMHILGVYAFFAGAVAVLIGVRAIHLLSLVPRVIWTKAPVMTATGFILTGLAGMLTVPALYLRRAQLLRWVVAFMLLAAAAIWAATAYRAVWDHLDFFMRYAPPTMQNAAS